MRYQHPFAFWHIAPDGELAYDAYRHIHSYFAGACEQYRRIYDRWTESSAITQGSDLEIFAQKQRQMQQVVRDIHCLLIFLQVISKTLKVLSDRTLYPHFGALSELNERWQPHFNRYRALRNTFEHYEDQVLGADTRGNSPGRGFSLLVTGGFALGAHPHVPIDQASFEQLQVFIAEFEHAVFAIVGDSEDPAS